MLLVHSSLQFSSDAVSAPYCLEAHLVPRGRFEVVATHVSCFCLDHSVSYAGVSIAIDFSAMTSQPESGIEINGVTIKVMDASDSEFAGGLVVEAFLPKMEHAVGKNKIETLKNSMRREFATRSPGSFATNYIVLLNGERAGYMCLKFHDTRKADGDFPTSGLSCCGMLRLSLMDSMVNEKPKRGHCYLEVLAVDAKIRGRGIGQSLLKKCDMIARERGCTKTYLHVVDGNPAIRLYQRDGFKIEDTFHSSCFDFVTGYRTLHRMGKIL